MAIFRFDHREGHDVIAASTTHYPESVQPATANELLVVHGVVRIVLELKLLMLLQLHRFRCLISVAFPRVLLLRLQSLFVSASTRRLSTFSLFVSVFLGLFVFSGVYML